MLSFFSNNPKTTNASSFGTNLPINNKSLSAEINDVGEKFIKTNNKYRSEIEKYKKIATFNKNLSKSYITNVTAMIDVSKLLNDYSVFFDILKNEIESTNSTLTTIKPEEIEYLKSLTDDKLEQLINVFKTQTDKVKNIYKKFGQNDEYETINAAQNLMSELPNNAKTTYSSLTTGGKYIKTKYNINNKKKKNVSSRKKVIKKEKCK